jgi:hypothetical protein
MPSDGVWLPGRPRRAGLSLERISLSDALERESASGSYQCRLN